MHVALTGASGFTGRFVTVALEEAGIDWTALTVDLRDREAVERAIAQINFDGLIHLAGAAFVAADDWRPFYTVNQIGTLNLLDAVARQRPGIRCLLASSAQVYGLEAAGLVAEDAPTRPANHYAISKRAMEQGADLWRDQLDIVVTRPFNYTGVGQGAAYLLPKLVTHFKNRAAVIELGNTWVERDFGDVRSVADAYVGLILAKDVPPVVNLCTGQVHSIGSMLDILSGLGGYAIDVRVNPAFVRANDVAVLGGDPALLQRTLPAWQPRAIADTLKWMYSASATV